MNKYRTLSTAIIPFFLLAFTTNVQASSDEAMRNYLLEVKQKCLKASGFTKPEAVGRVLLFDDSVGYDAQIIKGRYSQDHIKNAAGKGICLFNKKTRKAYFTEE